MSAPIDPAPTRPRATILVVDDSEFIRELSSRVLAEAGYDVVTAANGEVCVQLHKEKPDAFDLTVLDFSMRSGTNGEETFEQLFALNPRCKVILSSGTVPMEARERMTRKGLCGVLVKPYSPQQLLEKMRQMLRC